MCFRCKISLQYAIILAGPKEDDPYSPEIQNLLQVDQVLTAMGFADPPAPDLSAATKKSSSVLQHLIHLWISPQALELTISVI